MPIDTVAHIVRTARNGRSQQEFARELGVEQSSVSRYESGRASPPARVIEYCMRLAHSGSSEVVPTADALAAKVQTQLANPELGGFRLALARLIDTVTADHSQAHAMSPASTYDGSYRGDPIDHRVD